MGTHWECKECGKYNAKPFFGSFVCKWCGVMQGKKLVSVKMQRAEHTEPPEETSQVKDEVHVQDGCYLCEMLETIHHNQLVLYDRSERMEIIVQQMQRELEKEREEPPVPSVEEYKRETKKVATRGKVA